MPRRTIIRYFRSSQRFGVDGALQRCFGTVGPPWNFSRERREDDRRRTLPQHQRYRYLHGTVRREFAPFLPEIIIGAGIGIGWVLYRTGQGKPLTPDQALESQRAYRKLQEDLRRRNLKYETGVAAQEPVAELPMMNDPKMHFFSITAARRIRNNDRMKVAHEESVCARAIASSCSNDMQRRRFTYNDSLISIS